MTHEQVLQDRVGALRTRIRLLLAQQWLCVGVAFASLASLLLVAATRFQWWTDAVDYIWAVLLVGAVTGLLIGWTRRITPLIAAQIADERAGLKERLSTAVELAGAQERSAIAEAQIADAARHAQELQPAQVLPWRVPRQVRWLAAAAAVLLAALFVPDLPLFQSTQEKVDREVMRTQGAEIRKVAKQIEKKAEQRKKSGDENAELMRQIAKNMKQLGKDQERNRISKKQALLKMNELKEQLRKAEEQVGGPKAGKSMEKVAAELKDQAGKNEGAGKNEAAKQLAAMAEKLGKKDYEGAGKQLQELAQKMQSGQMSQQEMSQMAEAMKQMAQSMEGSELQKAAEQLKSAAQELAKSSDAVKQLQQQMAQAMSPEQRQQMQQTMQQAMQAGQQSAASKCAQAGGT